MSLKNNNRCDKYKNKKTYGFYKNYVYKQCNKCPKNKIWNINTNGVKPAIFTIRSSCHSKKESKENIEKKKEQKKKNNNKKKSCFSYSNPNWYGEWKGYPCQGTKDEKIYRKYLKEQINKFKKNEMKHPNPQSIIKSYNKDIEKLNNFYKKSKKGGGFKSRNKSKLKRNN